ncbi:MAG: DUF2110 family protein [Promethearchaeota archaeon]
MHEIPPTTPGGSGDDEATTLRLLPRPYGLVKKNPRLVNQAIGALAKYLTNHFQNLEVTVEVREDGRDPAALELRLLGQDRLVVAAFARRELGERVPFASVEVGGEHVGLLREVGKVGFGAFVDVGVTTPTKDALLPLTTLREQLVDGRQVPARDILQAFGLGSHVPVRVVVTKLDRRRKLLEVEFTPEQLELFATYSRDGLERVNACGVTRQYLKRQLAKAGHARDILEVVRLGWLEHQVVCKEGTSAPGILAHVGPRLPEVLLYAIRPGAVRRLLGAE